MGTKRERWQPLVCDADFKLRVRFDRLKDKSGMTKMKLSAKIYDLGMKLLEREIGK